MCSSHHKTGFLKTVIKDWVSHTSRINCIKWSPDSTHAATASLDTSIEVWSVQNPKSHMTIRPAHTGSVTGLAWISDNKIASAGQDGLVKVRRFHVDFTTSVQF